MTVSKHPSILVVDDDALVRETLEELFQDEGFEVRVAADGARAIAAVTEREFDAVLSDIRMPGRDGLEILPELRELRPDVPVILITAFASVDSAVQAMRLGAFDYITKPFENAHVLATVERALRFRALESENRRLRRAVQRTGAFGDLIGESPAMQEIYALIRKIAASTSNVLITGESGTGKEVVARTIHFASARAQRSFVPINCTAMPEGLLESELFGHVRGAFTGAHQTKRGLFEEADGGSLFLDEIGDMPPPLQAKLLRVLQDGEIRPVGGNKTVSVDVRVIAATNQDLRAEIEAGRFRKDLYYRLNVVPVRIPPLRERPDDIPLLAEAFLRRHSGGRAVSISRDAMTRLVRHGWDGNARELENAIERALVLSSSEEIQSADLALPEDESGATPSFEGALLEQAFRERLTLKELDEAYVDKVLDATRGNKAEAARILGVSRRTLYRRDERHRGDDE